MTTSVVPQNYDSYRRLLTELEKAGQDLADLRSELDSAEAAGQPLSADVEARFREAGARLSSMTETGRAEPAHVLGENPLPTSSPAPAASRAAAASRAPADLFSGHAVYTLTNPVVEGHVAVRVPGDAGEEAFTADIWLLNFSGIRVVTHKIGGEYDWVIIFSDQAQAVREMIPGERTITTPGDYSLLNRSISGMGIGSSQNRGHPLHRLVVSNFILTSTSKPGVPFSSLLTTTELHLLDDVSLLKSVGYVESPDAMPLETPYSRRRLPFRAVEAGFLPEVESLHGADVIGHVSITVPPHPNRDGLYRDMWLWNFSGLTVVFYEQYNGDRGYVVIRPQFKEEAKKILPPVSRRKQINLDEFIRLMDRLRKIDAVNHNDDDPTRLKERIAGRMQITPIAEKDPRFEGMTRSIVHVFNDPTLLKELGYEPGKTEHTAYQTHRQLTLLSFADFEPEFFARPSRYEEGAYILEGGEEIAAFKLADPGYSSMVRFYDFSGIIVMVNEAANLSEVHGVEQSPLSRGLRPEGARGQIMNFMIAVPLLQYRIKNTLEALLEGKDYRPGRVVELTTNDEKHFLDSFIDQYFLKNSKVAPNVKLGGLDGLVDRRIRLRKEGDRPALVVFQKGPLLEVLGYDPSLNPAVQPVRDDVTLEDSAVAPELPVFLPSNPLWKAEETYAPPLTLKNPESLLTLKFQDGGEGDIVEYRFMSIDGLLLVAVAGSSIYLINRDAAISFWDRFRAWGALEKEGMIGRAGYRAILDEALQKNGLRIDGNKGNIQAIREGDDFSVLFKRGKQDALLAGWIGDDDSRSMILTSPRFSGSIIAPVGNALFEFRLVHFGDYRFLVGLSQEPRKIELRPVPPGRLPQELETMFPPAGERVTIRDPALFHAAYMELVGITQKYRPKEHGEGLYEWQFGPTSFLLNVESFRKSGVWEDIQLNLPGGLKSAPFMGLKAENRKVVRREGDVRLLAEGSIEIYGGARGPMGAPDRIYLYLVDIGGMTFLFTRRIGTHETTRLFAVLPAAKEAVLKAVKQAQGTRDPEASFQMFLDRLVRNREIVRFDLFVTDSSQEIYFADGNFSLVLPVSMPNQTFERYLSRWHIAFYERERAGSAQTLKRYGLQDPKPVVNQSHPLVRLNAGPHGTLYQAGPLVACYLADFQTLFFYNKSDSAEISRRLATTRENQTTAHFSVSDDGTMGDEGAWTIRPVFARSLGTTVGNEAIDLLLNVLPGIEVNVNEIPHPGETPADVAVVTYPLDQGLTRLTGILSKELYPLISVEEMGMEPQEPGRSFYMAGPYLVQDVPGGAHGPRRFLVSAWEKLKEGQSEFSGSMVFLPLVPHEGLFYPLAGNHPSLVGKNVNRPESGSEASRRYESQLGVQTGDTRIAAGADAKGGVLYIDPTFSLLDYFGLTLSAPEREKIELAPGMIVDPEVGRIEELVAVFNDGPLTVSINTRSDYPTAGSWIPLNNGEGKNSPYRLRLPVDDLSTLKGGRIAVSYEDRVTEYQLQKRKGRGFDLLADGKKSGWIDVTGDAIALEIGTHFKVTGKIQRVTHVDSILVTGSLDQAAQEYFLAKLKGEVSVPVVYQASGESAVPVRPGEGNDWSWHNAVTKNISFARDGDFSLEGAITSTGAEAQLDSLVLTWRGQVFDNLKINGREWLWGAVDEANGEWIPFDSHALTWSVKGEAGGVPVIRDFTVELTPKGIKSASWVEHRTYTHASGDRQGRGHMIKMDLHLQPDGRIKIENASWSDENGRGLLKTAQSVVRWGDAVDLVWEDTSKGYLERRFYRLSVRENPTILDNSQNLTNTRSYPLEHEGGSVRVVWEYEGDKIRLHSVDRISGNGSRNLWNRRQIIPEDFEYQARVESEVPQFGEVESLLTVKHDASGFVVASDIQVHEEHGRWRWIGHKTFGGFWIQHMLIDGGAGKASGIHVDEGEVKDAKVKLAGETLEFRLSCEDGKIRITPLGLTAIPLAYERLDDRIVGNWLKGSSVAALLPHLSNEERFEKIGNISHRLQQLNPDASFFPDPESLIVMKDAVPGTGIRVHYCSAQTRLRFEVTMMFDSSSGSWRVLRDENTGDVTSKWNNQLAITTRYHLLSDGESELLPIPPGTTRLKSAKIPGNLNVPVFYNSTGAAGNDLRRRARNAVEGFVNYVSLIGTDLLAKDQGRFGSVRQWKGNDDGITAIVRLGEAVMGESGVEGTARSITFTTVYDPQEGSFYFNDGRTEITLDLGKGNVLTGLFQGFYHRETDSYLFVPLTDQKFAFRAFFFPGSDPLFIGITLRDGDLKDFPGARPFLDEGHARRPERKPSGSGRPTGQAPTNADTTPDASMARRRIHLSENLPIASRDLSPYLVNERDWENLITVTEADIGNDFKKHRWLHQTISTWLSEMGGDFQLLPESTAEFRQAQGELRQIWARHQNDFVALKGALAAVAPVRLWLMNANGVRLQVELMPYTPKKGQRPSWVFHPHGTTNQQVNLRFVGENPKNPGRMIQFFIPAFYKRNGADQTLAIYDPSLLGTGGIQKLKMAAFDGETWGQNPENDFLIALYDTNGVSGVESEEEPSPQESSPLKQTAARRRIVAEQRLMHLHQNVMETGDQFVVVDKTNNEIQRVVNAENPHNPPFTLLEHGKFGKGAYTGRLVQIQYPLPTVSPNLDDPIELAFPDAVIVRTRDDLTKRGIWEEAEYKAYRTGEEGLLLVHPANPAKRFELSFETEEGKEGWPRMRHVRGFEKGLELFYTPPHWNMVYPVERVRAEGTFGIGRVEDVTGEYEGRNLPDGHRVHRYHFSVHDGSLKKATRLDLELSAEGGIVDVHHDRWEVDGVALDPSLMRSEAADSKIIARLAEKFSADEFLAATPLPEGQVRLFLLHRAKSLKEAVGNTHYLAIDLKPDPETGNFLGQNVEVTRATFRHEPKDPVKFLAPSRLLNNFSYMRRTGNGAVRHSRGFMMVEPFESSSKLTFLFYDDTAQSRRKVEITLQKNGDASLGVMEPGSLSLTNYNDGTEIIHRADARLAATAEGDLIKYELHHPQMELHFYLTADGNFPADLNGHAFVIREFSTPQALVAARTRREEERTKRESVKAIQDVYKAFVSKNRSDWSEETRALVDGFAAHSLSNSGLGLAVKYLLPIYAENSEYPDEEVPDLIDRLLPRAMVFQDIVDGKLGGEEAFARLFPSVAARIQRNREAFEEAQALKEGRKTGGKGEKKKKGQEEDPEESREGSALFIPPDERTEKSIPAHAPRVLAEYLVALSLASTIPWMKREWEKLALALDNLLEDKILGDPSRVSAYGGFAHLLHQSRDLAIEPAVRLLVSPRVAWGRERDFYEYLTAQDRRRIGRQAIKEWFDNFGLADPLAEVPKKKERPVREVEDEPAQVANPAPARGPSGEKGVNYLGRPKTFSAEQAGSSRVPAKSGGGADPKPGGPGSAKASAAGLGEMMLPEGLNIYSGADTRQTDADRTMAETGHVEYMDDGGVAIAAEGEGEEGADDIEPVGFSSFGHGSAIFGAASFTQLRAANNTMHYLVRR